MCNFRIVGLARPLLPECDQRFFLSDKTKFIEYTYILNKSSQLMRVVLYEVAACGGVLWKYGKFLVFVSMLLPATADLTE